MVSDERHTPKAGLERTLARYRKPLGIAVTVMVAFGACYLVGYLHGRAELAQARAQRDEIHKTLSSTNERLSRQLMRKQQRVFALEARRSLDQSITALYARNFGIAEQHVAKTSEWLSAARAEGELAELAKSLQTYHLLATDDLGPQRKQISTWVALVDRIIVPSSP